jgi:UDP-glucose 4-epimerase
MVLYFEGKSVIVTGGCGFIGSHIIDELLSQNIKQIIVIDDLSAGTSTNYLREYINEGKIKFYKINIKNYQELEPIFKDRQYDSVIHMAAQPSVPISVQYPYMDFEINIIGSMNLLELSRLNGIKEFIFAASGGTVYGETDIFPTPEKHPLYPISNYGASKAAFEMYLSSFSHLYGMKTTSIRIGNVFGERSTHGVIFDFFNKLKKNPNILQILGNGKQTKSYLYIKDCVHGFIFASSREGDTFEAFNMAAKPTKSVDEIADAISKELNIKPTYEYSGGERGWKGDVIKGEIDCSKLESLGWIQNYSFEEGLSNYINWLKIHNN